MKLIAKYFEELTADELYEILRARAAVFVVEQNCAYQDVDGLDRRSLHIFFREEDGGMPAYLRAFRQEDDPDTVRLGRVLTRRRGVGLGGRLLSEGLARIREEMAPRRICIEAQSYAVGYYAREGFSVCSEEFLEDGIPHVRMKLDLP